MTNREFYRETFSRVRPQRELSPADIEELAGKVRSAGRRSLGKPLVSLAAVLAVMAALSAAAVAENWFGLGELLLPQRQEVRYPADPETGEQPVEKVDVIALSGWSDSPEAKALAEWQDFLNKYDPFGEIAYEIGNEPTGLEAEFGEYNVYTPEMANKLTDIVEKYGLKLHTDCDIVDHEELVYRVGGEFLSGGHAKPGAYIYEDGTFQFDNDLLVTDFDPVIYQLRRAVKGTFDEVMLNVSDADSYRQQQYRTASGEIVLLALGPSKGLIFADFPDCFVTVNVLAGSETVSTCGVGLTMAQLEEAADGIDFSVLKDVRTPDMRGDSIPEQAEKMPDLLYERTGIPETAADAFRGRVQGLVYDRAWDDLAELFLLPAEMTDGGGTRTAETAADLAFFLSERSGGERAQLMAELDLTWLQEGYVGRPADGASAFLAEDGLAGTCTGAMWFFSNGEGELRITTLQGEGWSVSSAETGVRAG